MLSTKSKIALARAAFNGVMLLRSAARRGHIADVTRGGIRWQLDLREGIDFAIYLLGAFERSTVRVYRRLIEKGDTVLDIGANMGAHTLPMAQAAGPRGRVFAFEPTDYTFAKLLRNTAVNPDLACRIIASQILLGDDGEDMDQSMIYASWPLTADDDLHPGHLGRLKETTGCRKTRLDEFVGENEIERVDFVKMDVDGNECLVLRGAIGVLERHRPKMIMELSPYQLDEGPDSLEEFLRILRETRFSLRQFGAKTPLPDSAAEIRQMVAEGHSINVLALPD
jgi:FkbM family methyltransferase